TPGLRGASAVASDAPPRRWHKRRTVPHRKLGARPRPGLRVGTRHTGLRERGPWWRLPQVRAKKVRLDAADGREHCNPGRFPARAHECGRPTGHCRTPAPSPWLQAVDGRLLCLPHGLSFLTTLVDLNLRGLAILLDDRHLSAGVFD